VIFGFFISLFDVFAAPQKYSVAMLVKQRRLSDLCLRELVLVPLVFCSSMKSMHSLELEVLAVAEEAGVMWFKDACLLHSSQKWMELVPAT
jgi:hypothetical protein